jgi:hypothetical protein
MARSKKDAVRTINTKPAVISGGDLITSAFSVAPPAIGQLPTPTGLALVSTTIARATQAPMAYINIRWNPVANIKPDYYEIEYGKQSDWAGTAFNNPQRMRSYSTDAALLADANTAYYVRVRAAYKTSVSAYTAKLSVTTAIDTSPPADLTTATATFSQGSLVIDWSYTVTPENFKQVQVVIKNSAGSIIYGTYYNATGRFIWTEAENFRTSSGVGITDVKVEVTPVSWANTSGTAVILTATSVAPDSVSASSYDFTTGDLNVTWTNPTNAPFKYIEVKIYRDGTKATLYRTLTTSGNRVTWTVDQNYADTVRVGGIPTPDPSVTVDIRVIGWLNQASSIDSGTATKAVPSAVTGLTSTWASDTGLADKDIIISWAAVSYIKEYEVTINGILQGYTTNTFYTYTYQQNVTDNTSPGDPTLAISIKSRDRLLQLSTAATLNAINAAPDSSIFTISYGSGFTSVGGTVALTVIPKDYKDIIWTVKSGGTPVKTVYTTDFTATIVDLASGTYTLEAQIRDVYDQVSVAKATGSFTIDTITIAELRSDVAYTDDVGNSSASLDVLRDNILNSGGVLYTSPTAGSFRQTRYTRPGIDRYKTITVSMALVSGTAPQWHVMSSQDGITWRYFAGPVVVDSDGDTYTLTEWGSMSSAHAHLVDSAVYGNSTKSRIELPGLVEARFFEIHHSSGTAGHTHRLYEFYPRRLVQSDDIEAESIKAINLAVGAVVADRISVTTLGAIQTSTGTLSIASGGYIKSGQTAYDTGTGFFFENNGGTPRFSIGNSGGTKLLWDGTNLTLQGSTLVIQSSTSTTRIEMTATSIRGLNAGVEQVAIRASDGKLVAGAGNVTLDTLGVSILASAAINDAVGSYKFIGASGKTVSGLYGQYVAGLPPTMYTTLLCDMNGLYDATEKGVAVISVTAKSVTTSNATASLVAQRGISTIGSVSVLASSSGTTTITLSANAISTSAPITVSNISDQIITVQSDGNASQWYGRIISKNATADSAAILGTYGTGEAGVFAHNNALNVWKSLYLNTIGTSYYSTIAGYFYTQTITLWGALSVGGVTPGLTLYTDGGNWAYFGYGTDAVMRIVAGNSTNNKIYIGYSASYGGAFTTYMSLSSAGVGINTAIAGSVILAVNGQSTGNTAYGLAVRDSSSANTYYVRNDGYCWAKGTMDVGGFNNRSDIRLKTDIQPIENALSKIRGIQSKQWRWIANPDTIHYGPIAQEVESTLPELIDEGMPGPEEKLIPGERGLLSLKLNSVIGLLIAAVNELADKVTKLEEKQ